ncbi:hypothetical protein [Streptomyces sp. SID3343]|uniref:hypothetical protein n=1 Tax=Streptomyces sp. SID3343 TaxID=2690260 RepID=UPI00136B5CD7|nr:hypothetical protein [Streptomyces sp. SID3343]MYW05434.1 hypothetical protein [Streptomyces sp. SID3343]
MRRHPYSADRCLAEASNIPDSLSYELDRCAHEQGLVLLGAMEYEFVFDPGGDLSRSVRHEVLRMRRRQERRPWRRRRMVLVRAWQSTEPVTTHR